jgi:hypothetical protein
MGPSAGLDPVEKIEISVPCRESEKIPIKPVTFAIEGFLAITTKLQK